MLLLEQGRVATTRPINVRLMNRRTKSPKMRLKIPLTTSKTTPRSLEFKISTQTSKRKTKLRKKKTKKLLNVRVRKFNKV